MFLFHSCNNLLNSYFTIFVFLFLFFLFHDLYLGLSMPLFSFWFKKSHGLGCFCAHDNLNKLPFYFLLLLSFCVEIMSTSMEEILVILRNFEQENQTLHEFIAHLQTTQVLTILGYVSATKP